MNKKMNKKTNKKMNKIITIGLSLLLMIALIGIPQASAQFPYLGLFNQQYGTAGTKLDTCTTCHAANFARNSYGVAYGSNGHSFTAIESMDSDGDGFSNIVEINALTFPGNPTDKPTPPPDTTPPVITVIGNNPVDVPQNSVYTDDGASAIDVVDGVVTVTSVSTVNTAVIGSYTVTYTAKDIAGNTATAVRTVNVVAIPDTTPPVITVIGENPVNIDVGGKYVDAGATATDNVDPIVNVVTSGTVDTTVVGTYTLTYSAQDAAGNVAIPKTRTVNVNAIVPPPDTTPPVITLVGFNPVEITVGSTYVDAGATAFDNIDGDITASIVKGGLPIDTSLPGSHVVTYNVKDSLGNAATQVTRTVNVVDKTPPVITLLGFNPVEITVGSTYVDAGATALDNIDGDITASIVTVNPVNTAVKGTYTVTYNVKDSIGNAATQVTRTVNVVDTIPPVITLLGNALVTINVGSAYTDAGATALDNADGDITASIVTNGLPIDTSVSGSHIVTYNVKDSSGNAATQVTRTVSVVDLPPVGDTVPPVITLVGFNTVEISVGSTYVDAGATARDNIDGDVTASIVTGGLPIDTSITGSHVVTYNVKDSSGNVAIQVTRTVNVISNTPPEEEEEDDEHDDEEHRDEEHISDSLTKEGKKDRT